MHDSLYRNSIYLIASSGLTAIINILFWAVAARYYPANQIGTVTALISTLGFIVSISMLGLGESLIRFLPTSKNKQALANTSLLISLAFGSIVTILSIPLLSLFEPSLSLILGTNNGRLLYFVYVLATILSSIQDAIFITNRKADYVLIRNICGAVVKLLLILPLNMIGEAGLLIAVSFAPITSSILGIYFLSKVGFRPSVKFTKNIRSWTNFSLVNYSTGLTANIVIMIVPLAVYKNLGASYAAYYFMAYSISSGLRFIPQGITKSLFAEGSNDINSLQNQTIKALKTLALIMLPLGALFFLLSPYILLIFGTEYSEFGTICLQILIIVSLISCINYIGDTLLTITKRLKLFTITKIYSALSVFIFVIPLMHYGLNGVAFGWFLSEISVVIIYLFIFRRQILELVNANPKT